jgi:His-Xaa-Ser system protein HxsD
LTPARAKPDSCLLPGDFHRETTFTTRSAQVSIELTADVALYPIDAVMGTAYVFIDRCYVFLDRRDDGNVRISLTSRPGTSEEALAQIAGEFQNELLGQALRQRIAARHEKVREAIVARALFGAAPRVTDAPVEAGPPPTDAQLGVEPQFVPAENDDYLEDPLGIAVPWEQKYAKDGAAPTGATAGAPTTPGRDSDR